MLKKSYAFVSQPNAHFRVRLLEAHYEFYGNKTGDDIHRSNHMLREKLRSMGEDFVPLDVGYHTDYEDGRMLSLEALKISAGKKKLSIKSIIKDAVIYQGHKHYQDFYEIVTDDNGNEKKKRTKPSKALYYEYEGQRIPLDSGQSLCDYLVFRSLKQTPEKEEKLLQEGYNVFSDGHYVPKKTDFSASDSLALYVALREEGLLEEYRDDLSLLLRARDYH